MASLVASSTRRKHAPRDSPLPSAPAALHLGSPVFPNHDHSPDDVASGSGLDPSDSHGGGGTSSSSNNNNNNSGQNHSDSSDGTDHDDAPTGQCQASPSPSSPPKQCMVVNENDPRFRYGPGWIVDSNDPSGDHNTTHFSMMNGSYAVVSFTGTSITVFGILERSNATSITATFSLDGDEPVRSTLPATSSPCLHNQAFFQSMQLRNTNHNLTINVTNVHNIPFILDYVWLCSGTQTSSNADLKPSASAKPQTSRFSRYDGIIVGSVLGGVFLVLGLAALAWFCIRRRNRRRQLRQLNIAASPVSSWLHRQQNSGSGGTEIVFTSTESIMRDNPEYSGSEGSKTGPNHLLSLPITSAFNSPEMPPGLGLSNLSPYAAGPDHSAGLAPPPWTVQGRVR